MKMAATWAVQARSHLRNIHELATEIAPPGGAGRARSLLLISIQGAAQVLKHLDPNKPRPDLVNVRYGPHERNVLDLWKAPPRAGTGPTPLVVFFHGGGFIGGDKSSVPAWLVERCLAEGISVASANYRLSTQSPFPAPMLDGARAIQFLRLQAKELGIDPTGSRPAATRPARGSRSGSDFATIWPIPRARTPSFASPPA